MPSNFYVNHMKEVAFCSFFLKFEILKASIVGMSLVYKVYVFSPNRPHPLANYLQVFKMPSDNMFALNSLCSVKHFPL